MDLSGRPWSLAFHRDKPRRYVFDCGSLAFSVALGAQLPGAIDWFVERTELAFLGVDSGVLEP